MNDRDLDHALARLPVMDLDPLPARATSLAAQRRLARARPLTVWERREPALLAAFAAAHLVWLIVHVYTAG